MHLDGTTLLRRRRIVKSLLFSPLLSLGGIAGAQTPTSDQQATQPAPNIHVFGSDAAMVLNTIKADHITDFEFVLERLKAALHASADPIRKQQASGWKIFKGADAGPNNTRLYVFWINPAQKGADYTVTKILQEAFPTEVYDLYKKFSSAYATGQMIVNLQLLSNMANGV